MGTLTTADGGRSWTCGSAPRDVMALSAAAPSLIWAAVENRDGVAAELYASDDGGQTWHAVTLSAP